MSSAVKWFCGAALLRWSPLPVSCGWVRPLKASCRRLARRHVIEESLTFICHFLLNFPSQSICVLTFPLLTFPFLFSFFSSCWSPSYFFFFSDSVTRFSWWLSASLRLHQYLLTSAASHFFSVHLFSVYVIRRSFRGSLIHLCLLFTSSLPLPSSLSSFSASSLLCHLCPLHYQLTQSADHIVQTADTYHAYQIKTFTCFVNNSLLCLLLVSRGEHLYFPPRPLSISVCSWRIPAPAAVVIE